MKSFILTLGIAAVFVLTPVLLNAQAYPTATVAPPVSQPLVREGTLAMQLAVALKAGSPSTEAEAESALTAVGIAPRNGWIADYPVTPDIADELSSAVAVAADSQTIPMSGDEALTAFEGVLAQYNLPVRGGSSTDATNPPADENYPDTTVINNYYYDEGPPVVTYYAPPPDYSYLYSWVPYPFWWWNFWFPGFYVLVDFDIGAHGHHGHFHDHGYGHHGHDGDHGDGHYISNHFRDRATGRTLRIDPATRSRGGYFGDRGAVSNWSSPSAERSARAIVGRSRAVNPSGLAVSPSVGGQRSLPSRGGTRISPSVGSGGRSYVPAGRTYGNPSYSGSRSADRPSYSVPSGRIRSYNAPSSGYSGRAYSQPAYRTPSVQGRSFSGSSMGSRTFVSPSSGTGSFGLRSGGGGEFRSHGGGGGSFGGRSSFRGGMRR